MSLFTNVINVKFLGRMGDCRGIHFRTGATMRAGETE